MIRRTVMLLVFGFGLVATAPVVAQQLIGTAVLVARWAYGTPPGQERQDLLKEDNVVSREMVETVPLGALHIRFLDNTDVRLGSASSVVLDRFVYDPGSNTGQFAASLGKGVFRFITGTMDLGDGDFQVVTPHAVIGVRGTDFIVLVTAILTRILVLEGEVTVSQPPSVPAPRGWSLRGTAGQTVNVPAGANDGSESPSVSQGADWDFLDWEGLTNEAQLRGGGDEPGFSGNLGKGASSSPSQ